MKTIISITALAFLLLHSIFQQSDFSQTKTEAERLYAAGSYARANEMYAKIDKTKLSVPDRSWVEFRLADTSWRAQAATQTSDSTIFETAQKQLEEIIRSNDKPEDRDLVWAEAHESLGDMFWLRQYQMNWGLAWPHYQQSLDWWAGQRAIDEARGRFLRIVYKAAEPPSAVEYNYYGYYGNYIPLTTLEDALKISTTETDKSHLHFLIAMSLRYTGGDWTSRQRVPDEFEEALKAGKQSPWYDDALFAYAEWMNSNGVAVQVKEGEWQQQPDRDLRRHRLRRHPLGRRRRLLVHLGRHPLPARAGLRPRAEERAAARRHLRAWRLRVHQAPGSLDRSQPRERLGVRDRLPRTSVPDTADLQRRPE